jgi:hypothetical protein
MVNPLVNIQIRVILDFDNVYKEMMYNSDNEVLRKYTQSTLGSDFQRLVWRTEHKILTAPLRQPYST